MSFEMTPQEILLRDLYHRGRAASPLLFGPNTEHANKEIARLEGLLKGARAAKSCAEAMNTIEIGWVDLDPGVFDLRGRCGEFVSNSPERWALYLVDRYGEEMTPELLRRILEDLFPDRDEAELPVHPLPVLSSLPRAPQPLDTHVLVSPLLQAVQDMQPVDQDALLKALHPMCEHYLSAEDRADGVIDNEGEDAIWALVEAGRLVSFTYHELGRRLEEPEHRLPLIYALKGSVVELQLLAEKARFEAG